MKTCTNCGEDKEISEFHKNKRTKDGVNCYCKVCAKEKSRTHYIENKPKHFRNAKNRDIKLDDLINGYKNKPCADCGESYPHYVMDFDHRNPNEKIDDISAMRRNRISFATIIAEIEKCDVVCSNCHRERTNKKKPSRYSKRINTNG